MKNLKMHTICSWCLGKKNILSIIVFIILLVISQPTEATGITYYYSEHCEICQEFEVTWNEFVSNESNNYIIKKKSTMDAGNRQELTEIAQNIRGRVSAKTPSIYIEFENKPPVLLIGAEIRSLYQTIEPGTGKTLSFLVPPPSFSQQMELDPTSFLIPVTIAAIADAVNPCAIFVFILAVSYASVNSGKRKAILYGITFAISLYLTYLIAGIAGKVVINKIFSNATILTQIMSGSLFIIAGFHIRTVLFPQETRFSELSNSAKGKLIKQARKCISIGGAATAGALCAMIELPCTGGPYAFALSLLAKQSMHITVLWLSYYNLIFISPILVLLFILIIAPEKVEIFDQMRNKYRKVLHLGMALCLIAAGIWGLWHYQ